MKANKILQALWGLGLVVLLGAGAVAYFVFLRNPTSVTGADPIEEMNRGIALLEQYQYLEAFRVLEPLAAKYPGWEAAQFNKGIAAWNLQDKYYLQIAEEAFLQALKIHPKSPHALFSLALLYNYTDRADQALELLEKMVQIDPYDPHAQYYLGAILSDKDRRDEARAAFEKAVKLQPSFSSAVYRLKGIYDKTGELQKRDEAQALFSRLRAADAEMVVGYRYGENGKYNSAIRGSVPPGWREVTKPVEEKKSPAFGAPQRISEGRAARRIRPDGRPHNPAFAVADLDGDGFSEIVACGQLLDGSQEPVTAVYRKSSGQGPYELWCSLKDAAVCAVGDLDSSGKNSLVLAGEGWLGAFSVNADHQLSESKLNVEKTDFVGFPLRLYCADIDSDWDLDIVCLRQVAEGGQVRSRLELLSNNRDGSFRNLSPEVGLETFGFPAAELIVLDFDGDVDADIALLDGSSGKLYAFENARLWRYALKEEAPGAPRAPGAVQAAAGDLDGDGDFDLAAFCPDSVRFLKNVGALRFEHDRALEERASGRGGTSGWIGDLLGTMRAGVLLLGSSAKEGSAASRGPAFLPQEGGTWRSLGIEGVWPEGAESSCLLAFLDSSGPPHLVAYDTARGLSSWPLIVGGGWIGLVLEGSAKPVPDKERANLSGLGATVEIRAGPRSIVLPADGVSGGNARSSAAIFAGLAGASRADYVRVLWPDSVLQSELSLEGGKVHRIQEIQRKPTSCPVLFAWDGDAFRFVGDFLGVGGLGYFELPGEYSKPDPSEYVLLEKLEPRDEEYALEILEPMEECAYLDELKLVAVDHPRDVCVIPEEMFAVRGPAPGFRLLALSEILSPLRATDERGRDVTEELSVVDARYGNDPDRDPRFPGLARSNHAIELEFSERLDSWLISGAEVHLALHGFVEYGYSTSNFAAWQAGARFRAPTVSVEREGLWVALREEWGFPAGYPRYMTVDLSGLLRPGDRKLRVETNMVIRWDRAFLGLVHPKADLRLSALSPDRAELEFRGFPAEEPMEGSIHPVYVYRDFDVVAPIKVFPGRYTRYGDVRELLEAADDRYVIMGPGDGLSLRISAGKLTPVPDGYRRTFLLKAFGYCKDSDLYTARPDRVEPLPFLGMPAYPYDGAWPYERCSLAPSSGYPDTPAHRKYALEWNTRVVEGRMLDPVWRELVPGGERGKRENR